MMCKPPLELVLSLFMKLAWINCVANVSFFINASGEWLLNPDLGGLPQSQIVIEILEDIEVNDALLHALRKLKYQGYTLALDDFELTDANRALLALADIVKFDISTGLPHCAHSTPL